MRIRLVGLLLVALTASTVSAAITGSVVDQAGRPLAGARVSAFAPETYQAYRERLMSKNAERTAVASATTTARGTFSLGPAKLPVVMVQAAAPGYAPRELRATSDDELVLEVVAAKTKSGRVTANGKAVAGATVIWSGTGEVVATTDAEGKYETPDPTKFASSVLVIHPDYAIAERRYTLGERKLDVVLTSGVALNGRVIQSDGVTPTAGARVLLNTLPIAKSADDGSFKIPHAPMDWRTVSAISGSSVAHVARQGSQSQLVLKLRRSALVSGTVIDARTKLPVAGVELALGNRGEALTSALTDARGNFELSAVRAGTHPIMVSHPAYYASRTNLDVAEGQRVSRSIAVSPLSRVSGIVIDEGKRPVAGTTIILTWATRPTSISSDDFVTPVPAAPDGRFSIRGRIEGDVRIDVVKKGAPIVHSAPFTLASGEIKKGVTVVMPRGIEVTGRVTDNLGKPLAGVGVDVEDGERTWNFSMNPGSGEDDSVVRTGSDGTFSLRLKEGTYTFGFYRDGYVSQLLVLQKISSSSKPFDVRLDPGAEITGRLTRGGVPIEGASIMAYAQAMIMGPPARTMTSADGGFALRNLPTGTLRLGINKPEESVSENRAVTAPATDINIELAEGGTIRGRAVDKASGSALQTFRVGVAPGAGPMRFPPVLKDATSDDGSFVLEHVNPGVYQVVATAAGHAMGRVAGINVENAKTVEGVEIALPVAVRLTGRVTGPDGSPLSGAEVREQLPGMPNRSIMPGDNAAVTDSEGEYSIDTLEEGERSFSVARRGFVTEQRAVKLSQKETRLDVQLSRGLRISGTVVAESGTPVAEANVRAQSAAAGGATRTARTDANGMFTLDALSPARYTFTAAKEGYANGYLRDFDVSAGAPVRITLPIGATIYGTVRGATADELKQLFVFASGVTSFAQDQVDSSGQYRIEGAPSGAVRLAVQSMRGDNTRTSIEKMVEVASGASVQVDLEMPDQIVIRGRVTQDGVAVPNASVSFVGRGGGGTFTRATTDASGNYVASGVVAGPHRVQVYFEGPKRGSWSANYNITGSATFDINVRMSQLKGRVIDAATGQSIADARIQLRDRTADVPYMNEVALSDASGNFNVPSIAAGTYSVSADKTGYGNEVRAVTVSESSPAEVEFKLAASDGVALRVVDARDNRLLVAQGVVYDMQNQPLMMAGAMSPSAVADVFKINLAAGKYRVMVGAPGYAPRTVTVVSPSQQTVPLTPGGTLIIRTKSSTSLRVRLLDAVGLPYGGNPVFSVLGFATRQSIAPGAYRIQVLDDADAVKSTTNVVVKEGETVTVEI